MHLFLEYAHYIVFFLITNENIIKMRMENVNNFQIAKIQPQGVA